MTDSATTVVPYARPLTPSAAIPLFSDRFADYLADHKALLGVVLLLLFAAGFNGQWRVEPDSALYLVLGRNLATGAGYSYQGAHQHLAFPGLPLLFAMLFKLFGTRSVLPALIVMPLFGVAAVALTYRLFLLYSDRATATVVTFGFAATRLFYRYCFELLTDLPFLVAVMAFLVGYEAIFFAPYKAVGPRRARWFDWALLIGGLAAAAVTRPVMYMLFLAILATLVLKLFRSDVRKGPVLWCMLLVVVAALSFYVFDKRRESGSRAMGEYEDALFRGLPHFGEMILRAIFEYAPRIPASTMQAIFGCRITVPGPLIINLVINLFIAFLLLGAIIYLCVIRTMWGMWVIGNILLMLLVVKPLDRYYLPMLPLLIFGWWRAVQWLDRAIPQPHGWRLFLAFLLLAAGANFARVGEMIVEQRRRPFLDSYRDGYFAKIQPVADLIRRTASSTDYVLVSPKLGRILTLYSDRWATNTPERRKLAHGSVWVLEPAGPHIQSWLSKNGYRIGDPVAPPIVNPKDHVHWLLRPVERGAPVTPVPSPTPSPGPSTSKSTAPPLNR